MTNDPRYDINLIDWEAIHGVFHVHAQPKVTRMAGNIIYVYVVPNEGAAWDKMQIFILPDNNKDSVATQVELALMDFGKVATGRWDNCHEGGCYIGQFGPEGTMKEVTNSGSDRFGRKEKP